MASCFNMKHYTFICQIIKFQISNCKLILNSYIQSEHLHRMLTTSPQARLVSNLDKTNKTKQLTPEQQEERKKIISKSNNMRALINLKALMDKRKQQRSLASYYLINAKFQSALIVGRQLMFTSGKIWKDFNDQFKTEFEEQFFFRTSKTRQHTEYLLDCVILCKIFIAGKKREDAVDILDKLQVPEAQVLQRQLPKTGQQKLVFSQMHEIYSKTCAVLLNLIQITKTERLHEYTQRIFGKYLKFVKKYYGQIQHGTALFKHANYLYENKMFEEAQRQYDKCIQIRKTNVYNGGLIDAIVNSAICLKQLCQYDLAIQRIRTAIQITKDIFETSEQIDDYYLFLGKLYFQMGDFKNAYHNYLYTFKLREKLWKGSPKKVQTELNFIFFYKTLRQIAEHPAQHLNLTEKKDIQEKRVQAQEIVTIIQDTILQREDFAKYKQFKTSKMAHLTLTINAELFELLTSQQIQELNVLKNRLTETTFMRGINQLHKSTFYEEKKTRQMLIQANPHVKNAKFKIN